MRLWLLEDGYEQVGGRRKSVTKTYVPFDPSVVGGYPAADDLHYECCTCGAWLAGIGFGQRVKWFESYLAEGIRNAKEDSRIDC